MCCSWGGQLQGDFHPPQPFLSLLGKLLISFHWGPLVSGLSFAHHPGNLMHAILSSKLELRHQQSCREKPRAIKVAAGELRIVTYLWNVASGGRDLTGAEV